jgi:hypothetical protein
MKQTLYTASQQKLPLLRSSLCEDWRAGEGRRVALLECKQDKKQDNPDSEVRKPDSVAMLERKLERKQDSLDTTSEAGSGMLEEQESLLDGSDRASSKEGRLIYQ